VQDPERDGRLRALTRIVQTGLGQWRVPGSGSFAGRYDAEVMVNVGVLASFEVKLNPGAEMAAFFKEGLPLVEAQPESTVWFAFRLNEATYGAFAAFANDQDRAALLSAGGPQLSQKYMHLFMSPPTFEKVDLLEARI
jgi:hypothetical protein